MHLHSSPEQDTTQDKDKTQQDIHNNQPIILQNKTKTRQQHKRQKTQGKKDEDNDSGDSATSQKTKTKNHSDKDNTRRQTPRHNGNAQSAKNTASTRVRLDEKHRHTS